MLRERLIVPAVTRWKRGGSVRRLHELRALEQIPVSERERYRKEKLKRLLEHAAREVPYYRNLFVEKKLKPAELAESNDLSPLPMLDKSIIRENLEDLLSEDRPREELRLNSTGGSTGENLLFYTDLPYLDWKGAAVLRNNEWAGWRIGDRTLRIWGARRDTHGSRSFRGKVRAFLMNEWVIPSQDLDENEIANLHARIMHIAPRVILSYPTPLCYLVQAFSRRGLPAPDVQVVVTSAETLFAPQKKEIEDYFGCAVFNRYGSREFGSIAAECSEHNGLHVNSERFVIELVEIPEVTRQTGLREIVVTDLDNFGMPFIRYRIEDLAAWEEDEKGTCPCGRTLPRFRTVEGRAFSLVRCPSGKVLPGTFWTLLMRRIPGIDRFQVHQNQTAAVTVKLQTNRDYPDNGNSFLEKEIRDAAGEGLTLHLAIVEKIETDRGGKFRIVESELDS